MVTFTASAPPALLRISEIFVIVLPVAGTLEERIVEAVFPSAWNVNLVGYLFSGQSCQLYLRL